MNGLTAHDPKRMKSSLALLGVMALVLAGSGCNPFLYNIEDPDKSILYEGDLPGDVFSSLGEEQESAAVPASAGSSEAGIGESKPVGFINYGEYDATVSPYSFIPLGTTASQSPSGASTVSTANTGTGEWPNTSRFLTLPLGTYSWCVDWEAGDLDEDGTVDYYHYIEQGPTVLDQSDSDELELAEQVAISAPPASGEIYPGRCAPAPLEDSCAVTGQETRVYTNPGWVTYSDDPPEVIAYANVGDFPPPDGVTITSSGGSPFQGAVILYEAGGYVEATTSNPYSAIGVQPHGEKTIGWARVLFDGVEVWRGDTSAYWHDAENYLHAVYIEVRCFPPGIHTMRIEALGINGSGGGMTVPIGFFGFRE
jgi:hypothetical protein